MSRHLYQLKVTGSVGGIVRVNGPWDTWGRIIQLRPSGYHLIRGLGRNRPT